MEPHCVTTGQLLPSFSDDEWIYEQLTSGTFYVGESIEKLVDKKWTVFTCTPISNLDLGKFEETLHNSLQSQGIKFTDCSVTLLPELAVSNKDEPAIKIDLLSSTAKRAQAYNALFISRASEEDKRKNFINLPLLFCKGPFELVKSVNAVLQRLFENSISKRQFTPTELLNLGLVTSLNYTNNDDDDASITLNYFYPDIEKTFISYDINLKHFINLWKCVCESDEVDPGRDAFSVFYKELLTHFRRVYGIDLSFFILNSVKIVNSCIFKANGVIKTKVPETLDFLLRYLTKHTNYENRVI